MDDFDPWEHASTAEEAARKIAYRVAEMRRLYKEAVLLADAHGLRVSVDLEIPESASGGHNHDELVRWHSSAKHC